MNDIKSYINKLIEEKLNERADSMKLEVEFASKSIAKKARDDWKGEDIGPMTVSFNVKSIKDADGLINDMENLYEPGSIKSVNYPD